MQSQSQPRSPDRGGFFTRAAWQRADDLVVKSYEVTDLKTGYFPKHQWYGLIQQLQKAAVSVAAHIAEGMGNPQFPDIKEIPCPLHFMLEVMSL